MKSKPYYVAEWISEDRNTPADDNNPDLYVYSRAHLLQSPEAAQEIAARHAKDGPFPDYTCVLYATPTRYGIDYETVLIEGCKP